MSATNSQAAASTLRQQMVDAGIIRTGAERVQARFVHPEPVLRLDDWARAVISATPQERERFGRNWRFRERLPEEASERAPVW